MSDSEQAEPPGPRVGVVILAAGQGTRMRSPVPKVLHPIAGQPMLLHVLRVTEALSAAARAVVISSEQEAVRATLSGAIVIEQGLQLGTAHAVLQARGALAGKCDRVLVLYGDTPLVRPATVAQLLAALNFSVLAMLTARLRDPAEYGRVVRDRDGDVLKVEEFACADDRTRQIDEINSGLMAFESDW